MQKLWLKQASQCSILHLMHLFMSGLRASKYPGGQDGRQTPTWRMSFLSSRMKSLGEHLRQPLTSEQSSQPLAQAWLPSALIRLCLLPLIPRLPTAMCVQLRTRATTHSPSRIVTGQPRAPGRRGGLLLKGSEAGSVAGEPGPDPP